MKKIPYSDEACAVILMHHVIKDLNKTISSHIGRIYGIYADYSRGFKDIGRGFCEFDQYRRYFNKALNDSKPIYTRFQPQTLFEYSLYLSTIVDYLDAMRSASLQSAINYASEKASCTIPRFYTDYAPARSTSSINLIRGLKYMKIIVGQEYNIDPNTVEISECDKIIKERMDLEIARETAKIGKKKAKGSNETQIRMAESLGAELINPFALDALSEDNTPPKKSPKPKEKE